MVELIHAQGNEETCLDMPRNPALENLGSQDDGGANDPHDPHNLPGHRQ